MGAHLRPWLLEFVCHGLRNAAEWKSRANENVLDWEDNRSNIRKKIVFNDTSDRFLQLVEFTSTASPVKCRISDGKTEMIALISSHMERDFPVHHKGRSVVQAVPGSILTVAAVELVFTQYGKSEEQITLNIHDCRFQTINQRFGKIGRPKMLISDKVVQDLHQGLFNSVDDDALSQVEFFDATPPASRSASFSNDDKILSTNLQPVKESESDNSAEVTQLSQFATQVAKPRKRKRDSDAPEIIPDKRPVDVKKYNQPMVTSNNALLSLLPSNRQTKRTNIEVIQRGSRETSADSDEDMNASETENQQAKALAEKPKSPILISNDKQRSLEVDSKKASHLAKVVDPQIQQPWNHLFEVCGNIFHIPKEQQEILKLSTSWNPPPAGKIFPHGNLPNSILLEIQDTPAEESTRTTSPKSRSNPISPSPAVSQRGSSVVSDMADESADEDSEVLSWDESPQSQRKTRDLPPDSSFPRATPDSPAFLKKSTAEPDMETAVPRALMGRTYEETRVDMVSHEITIVPELSSPSSGVTVPADVRQIHREIQESSQISPPSKDPSRMSAKRTNSKALGDIEYTQLAIEDPEIEAEEKRRKWFDNRRSKIGNANSVQEKDNSSNVRSLEIDSRLRENGTDAERDEAEENKINQEDETDQGAIEQDEIDHEVMEQIEIDQEAIEQEQIEQDQIEQEQFEQEVISNHTQDETMEGDETPRILATPTRSETGIKRTTTWPPQNEPRSERSSLTESGHATNRELEESDARISTGSPFTPTQTFKQNAVLRPSPHGKGRPERSTPGSQPLAKTHSPTDAPSASKSNVLVAPNEPVSSFNTLRSALHLNTLAERKRAIFQDFKKAYPDYTGDLSHFTSMCSRLREVQPDRAVWDDFVIRQLTEYATYVSSRIMKGREVLKYPDYYGKTVNSPKYTKGVLTEAILDSLFPARSTERVWGSKSRDGLYASSESHSDATIETKQRDSPTPATTNNLDLGETKLKTRARVSNATFNGKGSTEAGKLFLPNADTYMSEGGVWKRGTQSRSGSQSYGVRNAFLSTKDC